MRSGRRALSSWVAPARADRDGAPPIRRGDHHDRPRRACQSHDQRNHADQFEAEIRACPAPDDLWYALDMESPPHPVFRDQPPHDAKLWRYLSFAKFASLLQSGQLHFTRVDRFDDHFEGAWPKPVLDALRSIKGSSILWRFTESRRRSIVASCWVESRYESAGMWRLYAPWKEGIAISTTFGKLRSAVDSIVVDSIPSAPWGGVARVKYVDHSTHDLMAEFGPNGRWNNAYVPFMLKNVSYEHEREVRALVEIDPGPPEEGWDLPLDLSDFIDEIVVDPFCEDWFFRATTSMAQHYGFGDRVRRSALARGSFYMQRHDGS
jgi:hypothetical protein